MLVPRRGLLSTERSIRVLHISADDGDAAFVARALRRGRESFTVRRLAGLEKVTPELERRRYEVLLIDLDWGNPQPHEAFELIRRNPMTATVILSSSPAHRAASEALRFGAEDFLEKANVSEESLRRSLAMAVDRHQCLERLALRPMPGTVIQLIEDLRNQLTIAMLSLEAAAERLAVDSPICSLHERARSAIWAAASLTREIDDVRTGSDRRDGAASACEAMILDDRRRESGSSRPEPGE